ncbi:tyrosine-type recombinase/integrase [Duganella fentianensis]|uniref:tyrosine-type recombinase/integrase n=1 Tax=Duganella fentianensis TaxID=2692177 RepID=UPI0032B2AA86
MAGKLPRSSESRKTDGTLKENKRESKNVIGVFGEMQPSDIHPVDIYGYLSERELAGAPIKANKEVALLSAVLEYGRRLGWLETNPCGGIKYNKSKPNQKYVEEAELNLIMKTARERGDSYLVVALCLRAAYLTVSRPDEMRAVARQNISASGVQMPIGKRRAGQMQRMKLIEWSPALKSVMDEALALQRTPSMYVFGNTTGQVYTTSGFNTILRRLMKYSATKAAESGATFNRFTLKDMRPSAVMDRLEDGDQRVTDATGHADDRMVKKVYDRRKTKVAKATK